MNKEKIVKSDGIFPLNYFLRSICPNSPSKDTTGYVDIYGDIRREIIFSKNYNEIFIVRDMWTNICFVI